MKTAQEKSENNIRNAWLAAGASSILTLALVLISASNKESIGGIDVFNFVDVGILAGFAFGVYKRSRVCVSLLLIYALLNESYAISIGMKVSPFRIIFFYFYIMGGISIFKYHSNKNKQNVL